MFSRRSLVVLVAGLIAVVVAGSAYAMSSGSPTRRALQSSTNMQEDTEVETAQDEEAPGGPDKASLIADTFGASPDAVLELHESGIGWGALFKLYAFARAKSVSVDELVAVATVDANGEKDFAFGEMKKTLTPEQLALLESGAKNLGQLVSSARKNSHAAAP